MNEFIINAKKTHGNKYDYSHAEYKNMSLNEILIICPIHGNFKQLPRSHLKYGCFKCGILIRAQIKINKSKNTYLEKVKNIHGDIYDYSKLNFIKMNERIIIICKKHGDFDMTASKHLYSKQGCLECGIERSANKQKKYTTNTFIEEAKLIHNNKYDYSKSYYLNIDELIKIKCILHNLYFDQSAFDHINRKSGCKQCGIIKASNTKIYNKKIIFEERSNIIHNNSYDYKKFNYIKHNIKSIIICKKCNNEFPSSPNNHLSGKGCTMCINKTESKLYLYLKSKYSLIERQFKLENCKFKRYLPFDFCIPNKKIIIELDGRQHFIKIKNWTDPEITIKRDIFKMQKANMVGYKVIRIYQEDVYNKDDKWLDNNLIPNIEDNNPFSVFISTNNNLYNYHKNMMDNNTEIVFSDLEYKNNSEDSYEGSFSDLEESNLDDSDLEDTDLEESNIEDTNLEESNIEDTDLYENYNKIIKKDIKIKNKSTKRLQSNLNEI